MMENQNGIMFLSSLYSSDCPDSVNLHPLDPALTRKIGIITKKKAKLAESTKIFMEYLNKYTEDK